MAGIYKKKNRTMMPRWRLFNDTANLGDLTSIRERMDFQYDEGALAQLSVAFELSQTILHAADLLSTSFVVGRSDLAEKAARFLLDHRDDVADPALQLAQAVLGGPTSNLSPEIPWEIQARSDRSHLHRAPHDPVRWADLGLAQTILGSKRNALRCLIVASQLAPRNRFVVRAAVRCFMHWDEPDRAQAVLGKALAGSNDPWLLVADMAVRRVRGRRPQNVNNAKAVVNDRSIVPHHISELATAIVGLELESGSLRSARRFLERGMTDPTENAVAQVEWWMTEKQLVWENIQEINTVPRLYEAKARDRYAAGDWMEALKYAVMWLGDQPFSSGPADMAAFSASLIQRYDLATKYLKDALRSNPAEPMMINNLAYFQAMDDQLEAACKTFSKLDSFDLNDDDAIVIQATSGLLLIRKGAVEDGRKMYRRTIDQARLKNRRSIQTLATLNLAREEYRLGNLVIARELFAEARGDAEKLKDAEISTTLKITEAALFKESPIGGV